MDFKNLASILVLGFLCTNIQAQDQERIPPGISIAIKAGNAAEMAKYMNSTVELLLLGKEDFYKKNVAENLLKDFFEIGRASCRERV